MNPHLNPESSRLSQEEQAVERALRPKKLHDFFAQQKVVDNLRVFIQAALQRGETLDHVLLHGDFAAMNAAWEAWLPTGAAPARTTVQATLAAPELRVEITVVAAQNGTSGG